MTERTFRANYGLDWLDPKTGQPRRVEAGETATDIPAASIDWMVKQNVVTELGPDGEPLSKKGKK